MFETVRNREIRHRIVVAVDPGPGKILAAGTVVVVVGLGLGILAVGTVVANPDSEFETCVRDFNRRTDIIAA